MHSLNMVIQSSSNFALVIVQLKSSFSPRASTSIVVYVADERILLALSHWVRSRRILLGLLLISTPFFFTNSAQQYSTSLLSKSSPPKCVSPAVALTSNIPSSMVSNETSKVPPPRSKIKTCSNYLAFLSRP